MADESYWMYKAASSTPTYEEAWSCGAINSKFSKEDWHSLSPGMRREIVRSFKKKM